MRSSRRLSGSWFAVLLLACSSRPTPVADGPAVPSPVVRPRVGGTKMPPAAPGRERLVDAWPAAPSLDGREIGERSEGPWAVRTLVGGGGAGEMGDEDVWGGLAGSEIGESFGTGGFGLVGTGRGGGGTGEGTIGLGSIGTIGKGGGTGTGSGYGRGAGAPRPASARSEMAAKPSFDGGFAPPAQKGPLRAGATDDNADFKAFLKYLEESRQRLAGRFQEIDVSGRTFVRVVDRDGDPVPAAKVQIVDGQGRELWLATTYGDGRSVYYPRLGVTAGQGGEATTVVAYGLGVDGRASFRGEGDEVTVTLPAARPEGQGVDLEVVFLIDTTGSMGDEIAQIKATLLSVTDKVRGLGSAVRLRYGAVLFRDTTDAYVTMAHPFTDDIKAFDAALQQIDAGGGGDYPESVNQGLLQAITGMGWREGSAKVVFLIGDAPPQMQLKGDVLYGASARAATQRGIRVHAVAASGLDPVGSVVFRQVAQFTRGRFIFIEYGGDVRASAAKHGVGGPVSSNNLDDIVFSQIKAEVLGWGKK